MRIKKYNSLCFIKRSNVSCAKLSALTLGVKLSDALQSDAQISFKMFEAGLNKRMENKAGAEPSIRLTFLFLISFMGADLKDDPIVPTFSAS